MGGEEELGAEGAASEGEDEATFAAREDDDETDMAWEAGGLVCDAWRTGNKVSAPLDCLVSAAVSLPLHCG